MEAQGIHSTRLTYIIAIPMLLGWFECNKNLERRQASAVLRAVSYVLRQTVNWEAPLFRYSETGWGQKDSNRFYLIQRSCDISITYKKYLFSILWAETLWFSHYPLNDFFFSLSGFSTWKWLLPTLISLISLVPLSNHQLCGSSSPFCVAERRRSLVPESSTHKKNMQSASPSQFKYNHIASVERRRLVIAEKLSQRLVMAIEYILEFQFAQGDRGIWYSEWPYHRKKLLIWLKS